MLCLVSIWWVFLLPSNRRMRVRRQFLHLLSSWRVVFWNRQLRWTPERWCLLQSRPLFMHRAKIFDSCCIRFPCFRRMESDHQSAHHKRWSWACVQKVYQRFLQPTLHPLRSGWQYWLEYQPNQRFRQWSFRRWFRQVWGLTRRCRGACSEGHRSSHPRLEVGPRPKYQCCSIGKRTRTFLSGWPSGRWWWRRTWFQLEFRGGGLWCS